MDCRCACAEPSYGLWFGSAYGILCKLLRLLASFGSSVSTSKEDTTSSPEQRQQIACLMCDLLSLLWSRVVKRCTSCRCFGLESNANDLLLLLWSRSENMQFVAFALDSKWCPRCSNAKKPKNPSGLRQRDIFCAVL